MLHDHFRTQGNIHLFSVKSPVWVCCLHFSFSFWLSSYKNYTTSCPPLTSSSSCTALYLRLRKAMNKERQLVLQDPVTNSIRAYLSCESCRESSIFWRMAKPKKPFTPALQKNTDLRGLKGLSELSLAPSFMGGCWVTEPDVGEVRLHRLPALRNPRPAPSALRSQIGSIPSTAQRLGEDS